MKFLRAEAPQFSLAEVAAVIARDFGLAGELTPLYSERDQNFRLTDTRQRNWTVKVANAAEDPGIIACQIGAFAHIARIDPGLPVPRAGATINGGHVSVIRDAAGTAHVIYVLSYLPGEVIENVRRSPDMPARLGQMLARLGRALRDYDHPAAHGRELLWDLRQAPRFLAEVERLEKPADRGLATRVLTHLRDQVLPRFDGLRHQLIHGDLNEHNLLVNPAATHEITGIIDFGDIIHAALVQDVADLAADSMIGPQDVLATLCGVTAGYHAITPLTVTEIALMFDLTSARLLLAPLINSWRAQETPDAPGYMQIYTDSCLAACHALQEIGRDAATRNLRQVCGLAATDDSRTVIQGAAIAPATATILRRRREVLGSSLALFYDPPLHLVKGEGVWLSDAGGRRYLDCYNNVPHVGHCHPYVAEALINQIRQLNTNTRYLGEQVVEYSERLARSLGGIGTDGKSAGTQLSVCAFVNSGSEANDIAWRMAQAWSGAAGGLTMEYAYHGITEAIDAFSPANSTTGRIAPHIRTLTAPDPYRGPYRADHVDAPGLATRYAADADEAIASLALAGMKPAAFMVDSAFMTNGVLEVMPGYLQQVFAKVRAAGGLCIADEVQSGFGRMGGVMWGHRHHGVTPDIVTIGKPAGNGHPLGVVITRPEIMERFLAQSSFFSTFGGNNVSCAAGLAVLDVIEHEKLVQNAAETGAYFKQGLTRLMAKHDLIGAVRGTGLAIGVELVLDRESRLPARHQTQRLLNLVRDEGVLIGSEGILGNILKIRPPIVFQREHADIAVTALDHALSRL
ncbi:MAG TPA: aminotransferase class III-fold pyridoxal phosphate-dependent enzyme [Candidatus Nitrosotalea sp.]|nr:aminotransferase class III-fold pyridoxal phosphate-dependent enzyme [Candidatus Nitrosotalea sp.]